MTGGPCFQSEQSGVLCRWGLARHGVAPYLPFPWCFLTPHTPALSQPLSRPSGYYCSKRKMNDSPRENNHLYSLMVELQEHRPETPEVGKLR